MKNRYAPIIIVCGLLVLLIIVGQFVPAPSEELPTRIRLENKGGEVVFTHSRHDQYIKDAGGDCVQCHHEGTATIVKPVPCGSCHVEEFDDEFVADHQGLLPQETCTRCHHAELGKLSQKWDHDTHAEDYATACTDCHHDTDIEAEPGACNQCHGEKAEDATPSLRDAVHSKCEGCHVDMYEAKLEGCHECHEVLPGKVEGAQPACNSCHYDTDEIPLASRMDAYHGQCMGCHEESDKGPFGDESCKSCHTR